MRMTMGLFQTRTLWLSCLLLATCVARADVDDPAVMQAQEVALENFTIERARVAIANDDVRAAMVMAAKHEARRRHTVPADDPDAAARRAPLDQLAVEATALAIARGADDPVVQLLLSQVCDQDWASCDANAAVARLAELEPDNGLAALVMLSRAHHRKDADGARAALAALAAAERLDMHGVALLVAVRDLVGDADVPAVMLGEAPKGLTAADHRAMLALGIWLGMPRGEVFALWQRCRAAPKDSDEQRDCIRAARLAVRSDVAASEGIALALLEEVIDDAGERARIRQQRRDLDWQNSVFSELIGHVGEVPGSGSAHLDAMIAAGGEVALRSKLMADAGISMTAPADYEPANPRLRD